MSSRWVGVAASLVVGAAALVAVGGCEMQPLKLTRTPASDTGVGVKRSFEQLPQEVQDFVKSSYPDAEITDVREMTHSERMRHFEVTMMLPGNRKKTIEYNTFPKKSPVVTEIQASEPKGAGATQK
jgi:hypothetical protein